MAAGTDGGIVALLTVGVVPISGVGVSDVLGQHEVLAFVAPKIIGGRNAKTPVEGEGAQMMSEAIELTDQIVETIGQDVLISGLVMKCSQE